MCETIAGQAAMYILEARALEKAYGAGANKVHALREVDLCVKEGEFLAVMGPSGSGKSTLLHVLGGLVAPSAGQILLEGADLAKLDDDQRTLVRRKRLGFIFQSFNLLPTLTAEENVAMPLALAGLASAQSRSLARELLELVGMTPRRSHVPAQLSGGEQQRVALARALVIQPAVLLADEPTGNLDSATGQQVAALLRSLVDGKRATVALATHDPSLAAHADRIVHLHDGRIVREEIRSA